MQINTPEIFIYRNYESVKKKKKKKMTEEKIVHAGYLICTSFIYAQAYHKIHSLLFRYFPSIKVIVLLMYCLIRFLQ